jgi:gliding motility-associated-like protein
MIKKLIWFLIPLMSWGQCDMEIVGFNPISTDLTIAINGGACGTEADSIGEFILAISFNPPVIPSPFQCLNEDSEWAFLLYPLNFPGFDIGEGDDNILQTGDTITFNILEDTPLAGSGTLLCWQNALQIGSYFEECVILTIFQINDSETILGGPGLGGFPYPDTDISNSFLQFSLSGSCNPPPPPIVYGCIDPNAYNYNEFATVSDGSCVYAGCIDEAAANYNPIAIVDDQSCVYPGCIDENAYNYDDTANEDDGSCVYQGCLDYDALNYCEDCSVEGPCIYGPEDPDCNDPCIKVPNTFSPNGDFVNDYWQPITLRDCWLEWECRVYNRWGETIWWSLEPNDKWLGNRLDAYVPDGVYVWTIKATSLESRKVVDMAGHVTIFR